MIDYIKKTAEIFIPEQNKNGSFPAGHNGPYIDPETPVRNTAHWLVTLCYLFKETGESKYRDSAESAADYLLSKEARPMGASFWCRKNPEKDFANGLMGQAWTIEALVYASEVLKRDDCYKLAEEVFILHPWDGKASLWRRVNVDGSYKSFDGTFNHQLWFAAAGAMLKKTKTAVERADAFLNNVAVNVELYKNGVVCHNSVIDYSLIKSKRSLKNNILFLINKYKKIKNRKKIYSKSVGYHGFNMYAFSLLKQSFSGKSFWESEKFRKMISVTYDNKFRKSLDKSKYGYPYNPPGIEFAYTLEVFKEDMETAQWWIKKQSNMTLNKETGDFLTKNVPDTVTSSARIYEAVRLKETYNL